MTDRILQTKAQQEACRRLADTHGRVALVSLTPFVVSVYGDLCGALTASYVPLGKVEIDSDGMETWL